MLLVNGKVFDGEAFQDKMMVRAVNGEIAETGERLTAEQGEQVLDLEGDFLLPGFVDVHIHACGGFDTMNGEESVRKMSRMLYGLGVSAFCPTTMSASEEDTRKAISGIRAVMDKPEKKGATVLGAHMEAPFLQTNRAGAQKKAFFLDPDWEWLNRVTAGNPCTARLITLAPERAGSESFIRKAIRHGIHISIGHTDADAETVHLAADWGADHVTHTFNAQTPLHHRKPGVPGAAMTDERLWCEMICDGVHLHRDTIQLIARCKGAQKAIAITDAMEAAGLPDGCYSLGGQEVFVKDGEARLTDGTLAGSVLTMPKALENMICRFGIPAADACRMCTSTPAESIGEKTIGRMRAGSPMPLTRWDKDWKFIGIIG